MQSIPYSSIGVNNNLKALEVLKSIPNWVCYREEVREGGGKPTKLPKNPMTGGNAISTKPETWSDFIQAVRAQKKHKMDGLGWVFTKQAGIIGVDLDDCIAEGQVDPWAMEIVLALNSYTEVSPSGKGLHIFLHGSIERALGPTPESPMEMYGWGRYFTVTGDHLPGTPSVMATDAGQLETLWNVENDRRQKQNKSPNQGDKPQPKTQLTAYTQKAYNDEISRLVTAAEGCRNDTLNRVAFALGQFVQHGDLDRVEIESTLLTIAVNLGLDEREGERTISSGINGAYRNPRTKWPDDEPDPTKETSKALVIHTLRPGIDLFYQSNLTDTDYIAKKWGLDDDTVKHFKLGYCDVCPTSDSDSITIPYYRENELIDVRHRLGSPNGSGNYRPEVEGDELNLFNLNGIDGEEWVVMVYGEFKAMLLYQHGLPAVAIPSEARAFNPQWAREFGQDQTVYVVLDPVTHKNVSTKVCRAISKAGADARLVTLPVKPDEFFMKFALDIGQFCDFLEKGRKVKS